MFKIDKKGLIYVAKLLLPTILICLAFIIVTVIVGIRNPYIIGLLAVALSLWLIKDIYNCYKLYKITERLKKV